MKNQVPFLLSLATAVALFVAACVSPGGAGTNTDQIGNAGSAGVGTSGPLTCTAPQQACGNICTTVASDSANCGFCGAACPSGSACSNSECVCAVGFDPCNNQCVDRLSNASNCGACGNVCGAAAPLCSGGACVAGCGAQTQCGTSCVDTASNTLHCGSCGFACPGGTACVGGQCGCAGGQVACNGGCVAPGTCLAGGGGATATGAAGATATGTAGAGTGGATVTGTAGTTATGTAGTTATGTAGTGPVGGGDPAGFWRQDDWFGCAWTGIDDLNQGTTIAPQDFVSGLTDGAFCVSGTVAAVELWEGVALLGFNLAEDPATADCTYQPVDTTADGPPSVTTTELGLAVNFVKRGDTGITLRVQIQGPNGGKAGEVGAADRWCYTLQASQGKEFIPWDSFNKQCWDEELDPTLNYAGEPVSAVVFTVPSNGWPEGDTRPADVTDTPFEFCVNGFAAGMTDADAPDGSAVAGAQTGIVGANGADYDRAKVTVDGSDYVIQNNNWGNETGELVLNYSDNSFKITTGSGSGGTAPASFPSIFVGGNGFTMSGALSTSRTDNLPIPIANITSAMTTFRWSGSTSSFNAAYDVWFADPGRALNGTNRYNDGLDGFLMVWLHDPGGNSASPQPIGSQVATANIAGVTWYVWVGARGSADADPDADLAPDASAPVVSYVAPSDMSSFTFDLKDFITDATGRSGGGSKAFAANLLLTDVFAGFEIWSGGAGGNLGVDEFKIKIEGNQ